MMRTRPFLVGIAGASGSGKSFLADFLSRQIGPSVSGIIPLDSYYRDLSGLPAEERILRNFDVPEALEWERIEGDLDRLLSGLPIDLPIYDFKTHTRQLGGARLHPLEYMIVEGLFALYRPALRKRMDLKIFMDTEPNVCDSRRTDRDVRERGRTLPESIRHIDASVRPMFEKHVAPTRAHADILFGGGNFEAQAMEIVRRIARRQP